MLEVGTGSGYSAAVLSRLAAEVIGDRAPRRARRRGRAARSTEVGVENVELLVGDGSRGLPERAPFDAIAVHATAPAPPPTLLGQLADGGRLVVPIAAERADMLTVFRRERRRAAQRGDRPLPLRAADRRGGVRALTLGRGRSRLGGRAGRAACCAPPCPIRVSPLRCRSARPAPGSPRASRPRGRSWPGVQGAAVAGDRAADLGVDAGGEAEEVGVVVAGAAVEEVAVAGVAADHHVGPGAADQRALAAGDRDVEVGAGADQGVVAGAARRAGRGRSRRRPRSRRCRRLR